VVNLKDVAKRAGVSVSTASYSLNGSSLISDDTKKKVLDAAREIGYRPNGHAKNLKKQKTNIIGLFLSGFTGPFFTEMMEGIQDVVMSKGYELVVCASVDKHRLLVESYVDGAIILNYHMEDRFLEYLANEKMPIIMLDRELKGQYIKNVLLPNEKGTAMLVNYLLAKGHNRIGFIAGSVDSYDGETRLKGFVNELENQNISFLQQDLLRANFTESSGFNQMKSYLERMDNDLPTAMVCANDEMAMGAIRAVQESGLKVQEDIAIVGFDDIYSSQNCNPPLTTIRVPRKQWGTIAAQSLLAMLDNHYEYEPEPVLVELISRSSG
jgi:LacI family transcriptional regulator